MGETCSHSNSKHVRCHLLPCQQKEQVPESNLLLGRGGEAPEATQGTAASIWRALAGGSHGVLLVLTDFVFLQMRKKLFDRKLSNDLQKLHALKQLPQGLVRALLDEEAPVTLLMLQVPPAQAASGRASAKI